MRISAGEVEDLRKEIPSNLHHALDRGLRERRDAVPMNLDEFLDHIAAREGINRDDAPTTPAPCSPRCEMITQQGVPRHGGPAAGRIRAAVGRDRFGRLTQHGVTSVPPGLLAGRDAG